MGKITLLVSIMAFVLACADSRSVEPPPSPSIVLPLIDGEGDPEIEQAKLEFWRELCLAYAQDGMWPDDSGMHADELAAQYGEHLKALKKLETEQ